jgi:hypothetical protein
MSEWRCEASWLGEPERLPRPLPVQVLAMPSQLLSEALPPIHDLFRKNVSPHFVKTILHAVLRFLAGENPRLP